jgi:hypothetical protein
MRDWLCASRPQLKSEVLALYRDSPALALIRDVANGSKHMKLTRYAVDEAATVAREYAGAGQSRLVVPRPGGKNLEVTELAAGAVAEITSFMHAQRLL